MKREREQPIFLTEELEQGLIAALVNGSIGLDTIPRESLSANGQAVCNGVEFLSSKTVAPYAKASVVSTTCDVAGGDKVVIRPYLDKALKAGGGKEAADIIEKLYQQQALNEIINEANRQLASREFDPTGLLDKLKVQERGDLIPACDMLANDEFPEEPTGYPIRSLPLLTQATGGVMGVWAIGGKAKLGKSTLAIQIALDSPQPVLYYDMENGVQRLVYRIGQAFGGDKARFKEATKRFYIRKHIKTLDKNLRELGEPTLVVVDSLNKLPKINKDRRTSVDEWLLRFETLAQNGHAVILISELNGFGGYKETGEIEYTVDLGMQLTGTYDALEVNIVANRNRPCYGTICGLERINGWRFREVEDLATDKQEDIDL